MKKVFVEPEVKVVAIEMQNIICTSNECGMMTNETSVDILLGTTVSTTSPGTLFGSFDF